MSENQQPQATLDEKELAAHAELLATGKIKSDFFGAVRTRGMMNAVLETPEKIYKAKHPDEEVRWEYAPANGDVTMIVARESMGFRIVDAGEVMQTKSDAKSGPIRRGDLIMMAGPSELAAAIRQQDAIAAKEDLRAPQDAFYEAAQGNKVMTREGSAGVAEPTGRIKVTEEVRQAFSTPQGEVKIARQANDVEITP